MRLLGRLRFPAAAGLTYQFLAELQAGLQSGTHLRLSISPEDSIGTASTASGQPGQSDEVCRYHNCHALRCRCSESTTRPLTGLKLV